MRSAISPIARVRPRTPEEPCGRDVSRVEAITRSSGPGELGRGEPALALVLDAKGVDLGALRLCHGQVGGDRVEHAREPNRLSRLHTERHDVLNLEVDRVPGSDSMPHAVVAEVDLRA